MYELGDIIDKLWVILIGLFWYSKKNTDKRLKELEKDNSENLKHIGVLETKIDGMKELFEVKLGQLGRSTDEIKAMLNTRRNQYGEHN